MTDKQDAGVTKHQGDAERILKRAQTVFNHGRMTRAYHLYGDAIARLKVLFDTTQNREIGFQLAHAYVSGCYPAWRKFLARGTADRRQWLAQAFAREKLGIDLEIELVRSSQSVTDDELMSVVCHAHNLAGGYCRLHNPDAALPHIPYDGEAADHYVNEAYRLVKMHRPEEGMHPSLHKGFQHIRAQIAFGRGKFAEVLALIDEVIATEQARIDRARRRHKKLPPPNWMQIPANLRKRIVEAMSRASS